MLYVDFSYVAPHHRQVDGRLVNWARWAVVTGGRFVQPMFQGYRADESFDTDHGQERPLPVDPSDALKIERAVCKLPDGHKLATVWAYRVRCKPQKACRAIGVTARELAILVNDARQMLVNLKA